MLELQVQRSVSRHLSDALKVKYHDVRVCCIHSQLNQIKYSFFNGDGKFKMFSTAKAKSFFIHRSPLVLLQNCSLQFAINAIECVLIERIEV